MGIFSDITKAFTKGITSIAPLISIIPGTSLLLKPITSVLEAVTGTKQIQQSVDQATSLISQSSGTSLPFITPAPITPIRPEDVPGFQEDVDRVVAQIRNGSRSRSNVTPRLKAAVDAALGSFVFGAPTGPVPAGESPLQRYKREVLAGARSIDNIEPSLVPLVTSALKRQLAASVLKKFGPSASTVPERLKPSPAITLPAPVAARSRPILEVLPMPVPIQQAGFLGFGGGGQATIPTPAPLGGAPFGVPAVAGISGLARAFAGIIKRSGIGRGLGAVVQWARGNPGTATAIAISAGLTVDELIDSVSEEAIRKAITGGVVLSRMDLKGFNRTVRVAKKLKVFARRAPRGPRSFPRHGHTVRSRR